MRFPIALAALVLLPASTALAGVHDDSVHLIRQDPSAPCTKLDDRVRVVEPGSNPDPSIRLRVIRRQSHGRPCLPVAGDTRAHARIAIPGQDPSGTNDDSI